MSKSLAELRQSSRTSLPERTYELCLAQALVAEVQSLRDELDALEISISRKDDEGEPRSDRKLSEGPPPRIAEIKARLAALYDEMREHTGTVLLRGATAGEWRRWCDDNPVREDGRDARGRPIPLAIDESVAYGYCDASALMSRLGDFVVAWNGQPLGTGDWQWLEEKAPPGDIKEMARWVVQMHESVGVKALPKESRPSSSTEESATV